MSSASDPGRRAATSGGARHLVTPPAGRVRRAAAVLLAAVLVVLGAGCVAPPDDPPVDASILDEPATVDPRTYTVRIRSQTCEGLGVGSGFLIDESTIVTNRHVVEGAEVLEVETSEGQMLSVDVASQALLADLAVVRLADAMEVESSVRATAELAPRNPEPGDAIRAVGYPGGGALTVSEGTVEDFEADPRLGNLSKVIRSDVEVEPGSSGGPVVDADDRVVGVVYAIEVDTERSLIVPVETLQRLLDDSDGTEAVEGC
jgi:S1-C subfamily serine protease